MSRRKPPIAPQDAALWDAVARTVDPLHRREAPPPPPPIATAVEAATLAPKTRPSAPPPAATTLARRPAPQAPPLSPLDRRARGRLSRGATAIDGRIDLHGLTQSVAHGRLATFLRSAQADGAKIVLVITGKGRPGEPQRGADERGVLKRTVPAWLSAPDLRRVVIGFEAAGRAHGGEGALYVRIRRPRSD
ncbi:MAG: Smr/MutS family protein [Bauldia sp.]